MSGEGALQLRDHTHQPTCPLCREALADGDPAFACPGCATRYHTACARELGGCATLGCSHAGLGPGGQRWVGRVRGRAGAGSRGRAGTFTVGSWAELRGLLAAWHWGHSLLGAALSGLASAALLMGGDVTALTVWISAGLILCVTLGAGIEGAEFWTGLLGRRGR